MTRTALELAAARLRTGGKSAWYDDPAGFAVNCIQWPAGQKLAKYQDEILSALTEQKRVAARGPHGLGKTTIDALAVLWFAVTRDQAGIDWKIATTAGAWRQLSVYLWPEIHKWAHRLRTEMIGRPKFTRNELLGQNLKLSFGAAFAVASDDAQLIEGVHADEVMYIFDESKSIPSSVFDAAEGAFAGAGAGELEAYALATSTPGIPSGRFYDIHRRKTGFEDWWVRHVTVEECITAGRVSALWVETRRQQWGADSALFANRVLGEFHSSDEDGVIPLSWVEAANERWKIWDESGRPLDTGDCTVGVDVARSGADQTVMAMRYGSVITELRRTSHADTMATTGVVAGILKANPSCTPIVDVIGIGAGVVDRLREMGHRVVAFNASESSDAKDKSGELGFERCRSAGWWRLRELLDPAYGATLALPDDDTLTGDLTAATWRVGSSGKIQVESKDEIRKRIGRSTDDGDAVMQAVWRESAFGAAEWAQFWKEGAADAAPKPEPVSEGHDQMRQLRDRALRDMMRS